MFTNEMTFALWRARKSFRSVAAFLLDMAQGYNQTVNSSKVRTQGKAGPGPFHVS